MFRPSLQQVINAATSIAMIARTEAHAQGRVSSDEVRARIARFQGVLVDGSHVTALLHGRYGSPVKGRYQVAPPLDY